MFDECDICGQEKQVHRYRIEGAEVIACDSCGKHGTLLEDKSASNARNTTYKGDYPRLKTDRTSSPKAKDSTKSFSNKKGEKVLIEHYGRAITAARDKMSITRQELAKSIFIKETLLAKIESENIRPADSIIAKIEKALNIILFEESTETVTQYQNNQPSARAMTLGDFATIRKKKE